jgi:hypothetical protein
MAEFKDREHFIPLRKNDLIQLLAEQPGMTAKDRDDFDHFCTLVVATYHFEYHKALERLKDAYAPFDPDADTKLLVAPTEAQRIEREAAVFTELTWLMERANFQRKGKEDIDAALSGASEGGINMDVDLGVFERYEIFARGETKEVRRSRKWWRLWKLEEKEEDIWKRLVLVFKLRPHKRLSKNLDFKKIYVRVYKDIPKLDLETLIPGATPQMSWWDKGNIGVPLISGFGAVVGKVVSLLGLAGVIALLALNEDAMTDAEQKLFTASFAMILAGLAGYAFKSYTSYLNLRNKYEKNLSQALFYQTLDGNAGVMFRLLDEAEEQECREAILGYYFLWKEPKPEGWTAGDLDDRVEEFLDQKAGLKVDFEIDDALDKLEKLELVEKISDGGDFRYKARPIEHVLEKLDYTWDNYFQFNKASA